MRTLEAIPGALQDSGPHLSHMCVAYRHEFPVATPLARSIVYDLVNLEMGRNIPDSKPSELVLSWIMEDGSM